MAQQSISISTETILRGLIVALLVWLAYSVRGVLLLVFISLVLATIMHPACRWAEKRHIPRSITVFVLYVVGTAAFIGVGWALVPILIHEISQIAANFGAYWDRVATLLPSGLSNYLKNAIQGNINAIVSSAQGSVSATLSSVFSTLQGVFGVLGSLIVVLVLGFYFVVEENVLRKTLGIFVPKKYGPWFTRVAQNIHYRLGGWARGQIILSLIIGTLVYVALLIIGVPYAFALAALAALLEFIPYAGPIISALFGVFFALTVSPGVALATGIAYYIIQLLENNVIVPKVMQHAAGVNPVLSIIMILLAYEIMGVIGVFLGVPIASMIVAVMDATHGDDLLEKPAKVSKV